MKKQNKKISSEKMFNIQSAYMFFILALALGGAANYLSAYFYDATKENNTSDFYVKIATIILLGGSYMVYREIKKLNK